MDIKLKLTGHLEVDRVLKGLLLQVNHRLLQAAHTSAVKPLIIAEKLSAPEGPTGNTVDSIGVVKIPLSRAGALGEIYVGPRRGRYKGHAAHLSEYGTKVRRNRRGANRGIMPRRPWARPSWDRTHQQVVRGVSDHLSRHLLNYMRGVIKKYG